MIRKLYASKWISLFSSFVSSWIRKKEKTYTKKAENHVGLKNDENEGRYRKGLIRRESRECKRSIDFHRDCSRFLSLSFSLTHSLPFFTYCDTDNLISNFFFFPLPIV